MKELEREQIPVEFFEKKEINEVVEYSLESSLNSSEFEQYDKYWDYISSPKTLEDSAFGNHFIFAESFFQKI